MKLLPLGRFFALALVVGSCATGVATAQPVASNFGTPPSGDVPILFNDRHVYAKPDRLRGNRVLAAVVKGGVVLVPLRSLFEEMGATVEYDASRKRVTVSKPGAAVAVTLGKSIVEVNGEERPLDVPPEIYRGVLVVPLRVLSEGMGAYVAWAADKRLVVVRYVALPTATAPPATPAAPTSPPTAAPAVAPTPAPTAMPLAAATELPYEKFLAADYDLSAKVSNEISAGNRSKDAYTVKGGFEFPLIGQRWLLEGDFHHLGYDHRAFATATGCLAGTFACNTVVGSDPIYRTGLCPSTDPGCVTVIGYSNVVAYNGLGQAYVPAFKAFEDSADIRFGLNVAKPRVYLGVGGFFERKQYLAYPSLSGVGVGAEKLPDLDRAISYYGNVWYYPNVSGTYTYPASTLLGPLSQSKIRLSYSTIKFALGATIGLGHGPFYIDLGYAGESMRAKSNAPSDTQVSSPFVGVGVHL